MKTNWERKRRGRTYYAQIIGHDLVLGDHGGTSRSDSAGVISVEAFLGGQYQAEFEKDLGAAALAEALEVAKVRALEPRAPEPPPEEEDPEDWRCWRTPDDLLLVEAAYIERITAQDPLAPAEFASLLAFANEQREQTGRASKMWGFCRYYAVDATHKVARSYEEASFSYDDCLYSWGYQVDGGRLWKFSSAAKGAFLSAPSTTCSLECVIEGLVPNPRPEKVHR